MRFYVGARHNLNEKVREIYKQIRARGHEISFDWTNQKFIQPYNMHAEESRDYSVEHLHGARGSDVFILLDDEIGAESNILLGAALSCCIERGRPKIYVLGNYSYRVMFNFHPSINRRRTIEEVLGEISD